MYQIGVDTKVITGAALGIAGNAGGLFGPAQNNVGYNNSIKLIIYDLRFSLELVYRTRRVNMSILIETRDVYKERANVLENLLDFLKDKFRY